MYRAFLPSPALEAGRRSLRVRCTAATSTIACLRHPALPLRPFSSTVAAQAAGNNQNRRARSRKRVAAVPVPLALPGKVKNKANKVNNPTPRVPRTKVDPEEFPAFPAALFSDKPAEIEAALRQISAALNLRLKLSKNHTVPQRGQHRCRIALEFGKHIQAKGDAVGLTQALATKLAFDDLLSTLMRHGALSELHSTLDEELVPLLPKDEQESTYMRTKSDVYNFCAGLGLVPRFSYQPKKLHHVRVSGQRRIFSVGIAVPELDIEVTAASVDPVAADMAACQKFKTEVEEKTKMGALKTTDDDVDFKGLTVSSTPQFLKFYRQKTRHPANMELSFEGDWQKMSGLHKANVKVNGKDCDATIVMKPRSNAEKLTELVAAVQLARDEPHLVPEFQKALEEGGGRVRTEVPPVDVELRESAVNSMWKNSWAPRSADRDHKAGPAAEEPRSRPFDRRRMSPGLRKDEFNATLKQELEDFRADSKFSELRKQLASLPMTQYREKVLTMIEDTQTPYSIVVGATGSGKTTQVPQILLNEAISRGEGADCSIICTQPRRIAATSVARRVAAERGQSLGQSVGYQVRFDAQRPRVNGGITFCTTGILLEQLKADSDGVLDYASHILVDEVHERDLPIDFLMTVLKKSVADRQARGLRVPKIVLMSATLDTKLFATYLSSNDSQGTAVVPAPSISVPGRTFPVENRFLDDIMSDLNQSHGPAMKKIISRDSKLTQYLDSELRMQRGPQTVAGNNQLTETQSVVDWSNKISTSDNDTAAQDRLEAIVPVGIVAATIARIAETTETGAILAFLPGLQEIIDTEKALMLDDFDLGFNDESKFRICLLHSSVPREDQAAAFDVPPPGCRKIILSTNIAETSVTVPDVQHVVDTGKLREKRYDQLTRISGLQVVWESKSNSKQRAGRAGRVQNGFYHALFARQRHEEMPAVGLPELLRSDLQETILAVKKKHFKQPAAEFLAEFIEPPARAAVDAAVEHLTRLKALTADERLTPLGNLLAELPVHPSLGKMIVMGVIFRCLDPLIIVGAAASERSLFVSPLNAKAEARACHRAFGGQGSDHLTMLKAFNQLRFLKHESSERAAQDYAYGKFLHWGAFNTIHKTAQSIVDVLVESGLAPKAERGSPSFSNANNWGSWREKTDTSVAGMYGHASLNTNSQNMELVRGLIAAGLYPNLATNVRSRTFVSGSEDHIILHPSSENATHQGWPRGTLVAFGQMQRQPGGDTLFARDTTIIQPLTALLLADSVESSEGLPRLGNWLPFYVKCAVEGDGQNRLSFRNAINGMMRFKTSLDLMLDRAYSDLSALQKKRSMAKDKEKEDMRFLAQRGGVGATKPSHGKFGRASQDDMLERLPGAIVEILSLQPPTTTSHPRRERRDLRVSVHDDSADQSSGDQPSGRQSLAPPSRRFVGRIPGRNYGRDSARDSAQNFRRDSEQNFGRDSEQNSGRGSERSFKQNFGRDSGRDFEQKFRRNSERSFGRNFGQNSGRNSEQNFRRDSEPNFEQIEQNFKRDSERSFARNFGQNSGRNSEQNPRQGSERSFGWESGQNPRQGFKRPFAPRD